MTEHTIQRTGKYGWLQLFADPAPIIDPAPPPAIDPQMQMLADLVGASVREALRPLTEVQASQRRSITPDLQVKPKEFDAKALMHDQKGVKLARAVRALAAAKGDIRGAAYIAEHSYGDPIVAKALAEGTLSAGGALVPPEYGRELIELLYSESVVRRSGPRVFPMNSNTLTIPRLASGASASYIGENANIGTSEQTFDQVQLVAKKLAVLTPISNDLIRDASPAADAVVRDDLVTSMALREDLAFLTGNGAGLSPTGLSNRTNAANKFAAATSITATTVITDLGKMRRLIRAANTRMSKMAWFMSARTEGFLLTLTDTTNGQFLFRAEMLERGRLLGYTYFVSTQIAENGGAGTNETEIYLGDMSDFLIGENTDLLIDVSDTAAYWNTATSTYVASFSLDQTVMRVIARHDCNVRHDKSFSVLQAVKWV